MSAARQEDIAIGAGMQEPELKRRVSVEIKVKKQKIQTAAEGECPVRCAILYKGAEEWSQWLSQEQKGHMKRIDAVCQRPIAQLLNEKMDSEQHKSTEHNGYLIMRIYRAPYNLFMISHRPLDKELKPIEDPSELLSSKGLSILGQLDSLENIDKDDIYDYFNDGCQEHLQTLISGEKIHQKLTGPIGLHDGFISRRMLTPEELGIVSRAPLDAPEPFLQRPAESENKRRCTIL